MSRETTDEAKKAAESEAIQKIFSEPREKAQLRLRLTTEPDFLLTCLKTQEPYSLDVVIRCLRSEKFALTDKMRENVRKSALSNSFGIFDALASAQQYAQLFDLMKIWVNDCGVKLADPSLWGGTGSAVIEWPTLLLESGWFGEYAGQIGIDGSKISAEPLFSTLVANFAADPELPALAEAAKKSIGEAFAPAGSPYEVTWSVITVHLDGITKDGPAIYAALGQVIEACHADLVSNTVMTCAALYGIPVFAPTSGADAPAGAAAFAPAPAEPPSEDSVTSVQTSTVTFSPDL